VQFGLKIVAHPFSFRKTPLIRTPLDYTVYTLRQFTVTY